MIVVPVSLPSGETVETVADFILGGSKVTADGDCMRNAGLEEAQAGIKIAGPNSKMFSSPLKQILCSLAAPSSSPLLPGPTQLGLVSLS